MSKSKIGVLAVIILAVVAFFALGGHRHLSFEHVKAQQAAVSERYASHPLATALTFLAIYVAVT